MLADSILHHAYNTLSHLALPAVLARLAVKGWKSPQYFQRLGERLGFAPGQGQGGIWIHAVSVGEVQAVSALVQALLQNHPGQEILLTTTTPTGSRLVQDKYKQRVRHCYLPYDLPWAVKGFLSRHQPDLALFMETEIWPNIFLQCQRANIPLLLINARLSNRSFQGYRKIRPLMQASLNRCWHILAQSQADAARIRALGADPGKVLVSGNLKFDMQAPPAQVNAGQRLRSELWPQRPVWIAASTHKGEEEQILRAHAKILQDLPQALLIIAPRHSQRFDQVWELCQSQGFNACRRSQAEPEQARQSSVYLADSLGELLMLYSAADAAFVGGSLVPAGGHNLLEPASLGVPVLSGPYLHNFQEISSLLQEQEALILVQDAQALAQEITHMFLDYTSRQDAGHRARQVLAANQGALHFTLQQISDLIPQNNQSRAGRNNYVQH
ncbi:MAG: lipid IV(A) 3-deoxy-D-manno-octulosonic acid transferase [Thermodesulfobacteriota bacterium]